MKNFSRIVGWFTGIAWIALSLVIAVQSFSPSARAQVRTASIAGTVQDVSGAAIKGAQVKATQTDTQISQTVTSGEDGSFTIPLLPVGSYTLEVQYTGFSPYEQSGIVLSVGQAASVNVSLKPGSVSQTVEVTANAQIVETTRSNSSTLVDTAQVEGLPLNGRNPATLVFLTGGASNPIQNIPISNTGNAILQNSLVFPTEIAPTIHGVRGGGVYFSLDGANNIDTYQITGGPFPNPDATQEFSVVSGNYGAEYVSAPGGAVNIVTKSGTNQVHGDAYEFVRNGIFNARNFFSTRPDVLKRNQFGATLGAPIQHDKWFIFGSYEGTRLANAQGGNVGFVPTPAERGGDFTALTTTLKNPATGLPFTPNNMIPTGQLDSTMLALLKYIPSRTVPLGATIIPGTTSDEAIWSQPIEQTQEEYVVKSDYVIGNHRIFGRYFYTSFNWAPNGIPGGDLLASYRGQNHTWNNATGGDTWTHGNLVSDFRFTYVRDNSITVAGENSVSLPGLGSHSTAGQFPTIQSLGVTGGFSIIPGNFNGFPRHTFDVAENVNFFRGRHQISFGAEVQHISTLLKTDNQQNGTASFSGVFSGNPFADFALGVIPSFSQSDGIDISASGTLPGFFVQDRIRATSKLTVTAGLRWDPYRPFTSVGGRIECWQPGKQSTQFVNAPTGLTYPGDPGCNTSGTQTDLSTFQPRIGFAYQLDSTGKTVVRGGYGLYTDQFPMFSFLAFGTVQPFLRSITDTSPGTISNPWQGFPGGDPYASGFELNLGSRPSNSPFINGAAAYTFNPGFKLGYIQQWSLILERALATNDVVTLSYFGSKGTHLSQVQDDNLAVYIPGTAGAGCTTGQFGTTAAGQSCSTQTNIQSRRPDTLIGSLKAEESNANSIYHGVELEYRHRFQAGFTLSSAFTYSRSIDDSSSPANVLLNGGSLIPLPGLAHIRRGPSDFNQPTTWRTSGVWTLPFGKQYTGFTGVLVKGWVWSGIFTRDAGLPLNIATSNIDNSFTGLGTDVANVVPGVPRRQPISDFTAASQSLSIINPAAFVLNAPGTVGISGRNAFNTPGLTDFDTSLSKIFTLTERFRFQFRAEWFNAFNHPQFDFPGATTLGAGTFGKLTAARDPRIMQFSGKLIF